MTDEVVLPFNIFTERQASGDGSLSEFFSEEVFECAYDGNTKGDAATTTRDKNDGDGDDDPLAKIDDNYAKDVDGVNRLTHKSQPSFWSQNSNALSRFQGIFGVGGSGAETAATSSVEDETKKASAKSILDIAKSLTKQKADCLKETNTNDDMEKFWKLLQQALEQWSTVANDSKAKSINLLAFIYYLGIAESKYTPSYKRREHRFYPALEVEMLIDLHDALYLATISYLPSVQDITEALDDYDNGTSRSPWVLVYCDVKSQPKEPGHFICLKREQETIDGDHSSSGSNTFRFPWQKDNKKVLDVLIVVRGTKEISDVLSDSLIEPDPFRDGVAHGGIAQAGKFLVEKHTEFLETLLNESKRDMMRLNLIGHSLGAGAAAIACIEFNKHPKIEAKSVGFGCPPILSKDLSESVKDSITSVVCGSDVVPRMSGATISNFIMEATSYQYSDMALIDVKQVLEAIDDNFPIRPTEDQKKSLIENVKKFCDEDYDKNRTNATSKVDVVLYPPGKCIHLYRDGAGISGGYVPCTFFNEIEFSRTMLLDHMTSKGYDRVFHELMRDFLNDIRFNFRHDIGKVARKC